MKRPFIHADNPIGALCKFPQRHSGLTGFRRIPMMNDRWPKNVDLLDKNRVKRISSESTACLVLNEGQKIVIMVDWFNFASPATLPPRAVSYGLLSGNGVTQ